MASKDRGNAISTYLIHCFMIWYDITTNVANRFRSLPPPPRPSFDRVGSKIHCNQSLIDISFPPPAIRLLL
jgi:hypothetical protein